MMHFINTQIVKAQAALHVATDSLTDRTEGQAMVEYGLVLVLVSVVAIVGLTAVGKQLFDPTVHSTGTAGSATISAAAPIFNKLVVALGGTI